MFIAGTVIHQSLGLSGLLGTFKVDYDWTFCRFEGLAQNRQLQGIESASRIAIADPGPVGDRLVIDLNLPVAEAWIILQGAADQSFDIRLGERLKLKERGTTD